MGAADRILVGGTLLLFIDSLLDWQQGLNAWGGSAAFAGVLMALFALLLLETEGLHQKCFHLAHGIAPDNSDFETLIFHILQRTRLPLLMRL